MLYTVIDPLEVFQTPKNEKTYCKKVANAVVEGVKYNQRILLTRLISTNPGDYLNPMFQPGTVWTEK